MINQYKPQTDLVVGYRLADLYDFSGNAKTLTNEGTTTFTSLALPDGLTGKAAALGSPNTTKYLHCTSTSQADIDIDISANAITLAAWVRITALPSASAYPTILYWDSHETTDRYAALWYKNDGGTYKLQADFSGNVTTYSVTLAVDTWYFVVFTAAAGAGAATALYLNGASVATGTKGTSAGAGTTKFYIGKHLSEAQYWPGYIYNVAAYKKVFTAAEILDWYDIQVGTAFSVPYVAIGTTDLSAYVDADDSISPEGGKIDIQSYSSASRDFAYPRFNGRSGRTYDFSLVSSTRATLETLMKTINRAEELDEFWPYNEDRSAYVYAAEASYGKPLRTWNSAAQDFIWMHTVNCKVTAYDPLLYAPRKTIYYATLPVLPMESYTITNNGGYKAGLDWLEFTGYYDTSNYTEDVDLTIGNETIRLIDSMLHGDIITVDRFGHITHSFETDFNVSYANLKKYLKGENATGVATAGYHLSGKSPWTDLSNDGDEDDGFYIQADAATVRSKVEMTGRATCNTGAKIAAEMQTRIQALGTVNGAAYGAVTVEFTDEGRYKITSGTTGSASKIRITDSEAEYTDDVTHHLKLGTAQYSWWPDHDADGQYGEGTDIDGVAAGSPQVSYGVGNAGYHTSGEVPSTVITNAGYHVSGTSPATKLTKAGTKLKIQNDTAGSATEITLDTSECTTGPTTAAELQSKIRAISASYDGVVVRYENGRYLIISESAASTSLVRITDGATSNCANSLKLGTSWGGTNYDARAMTAGYETSGLDPSINISGGTDTDFKIQADAATAASVVSLTKASCTTGALTAAEMQTKIRALGTVNGAVYSAVTVTYTGSSPTNYYKIASGVINSSSKIRITNADSNNVADNLKIGAANGATDTDGACKDRFSVQADSEVSTSSVMLTLTNNDTGTEIAAAIQTAVRALGGAYAAITCVFNDGRYIVTSGTTGVASKIRITSDATNDIADRLKLGTANGGTNTDGIPGGTIAANDFAMGKYGFLTFPMAGPIPVYGAPYIEFYATSVTGAPKAFWCLESDLSKREYLADEILEGYNKLYFPDLQCGTDVWFGLYTNDSSAMQIREIEAVVRRDIPRSELPTVEPADTCDFGITATGSAKFGSLHMDYRDAFWS